MLKLSLLVPALALLISCGPDDEDTNVEDTNEPEIPDADDDGVSDEDEEDLGTDPDNKDSDGDRLEDGEELEAGTYPMDADTDGDGYLDGDEVAMGSDPTDDEDGIYEGFWPYYYDKDSIEEGSFGSTAREGDEVPRLIAVDQFGEEVDLYDFAYQGKPIMVDVSAVWCGPCNQMSNWLSHGESWGSGWDALRGKLDDGDFYWVTLLYQDASGAESDEGDVEDWDDRYQSDFVTVLTDPGSQMAMHINPPGIPSLSLIGEDMTWLVVDDTERAANLVLSDY